MLNILITDKTQNTLINYKPFKNPNNPKYPNKITNLISLILDTFHLQLSVLQPFFTDLQVRLPFFYGDLMAIQLLLPHLELICPKGAIGLYLPQPYDLSISIMMKRPDLSQ